MDSQKSMSLAAAEALLSNDEPHASSNLTQGQVEKFQVQSPGSESSTATTFRTTCSDTPNLPDLPIEIFAMIISQLSRRDVRSVRLVSKKCEAKASADYFRHVVVPFHTQVLAASDLKRRRAPKNISGSTLSAGGRVFDQFGHLIRRFALSLELDEEVLEFPPLKPRQEIIRTFWGLYRWPLAEYSRYEEVGDIEDDADEDEQMRAALRGLSQVTTLGFCSDAGWGFLSGPNLRARENTIRHRVFIDQDYEKNKKARETAPSPMVTRYESSLGPPGRSCQVFPDRKTALLRIMMQKAGFAEEQMKDAVALLLESEGETSIFNMDLGEGSQGRGNVTPDKDWEMLRAYQTFRPSLLPNDDEAVHTKNVALKPNALTRAQKEMLLEVEWANRAMALSYFMAAMDCSRKGHLRHLTTFNIAKIPSSHLNMLSRHDFWKSFPSLKNVSLGVVADWRRVTAPAHYVLDEPVSPLDAVPIAHELINKYIGVQPNIESFHFEWICGGELASGCHQRAQHILPAPFLASPMAMTRRAMTSCGRDDTLLRLPHVKNLSLKNCWVAPHVLLQVLRSYALCSLERVEFEGVSLSVMPWTAGHGSSIDLFNLGDTNISLHLFRLGFQPPLAQPSWLSWAGLIEHFSPSVKVRHVLDQGESHSTKLNRAEDRRKILERLRKIIPDALALPDEAALYRIKSLTFKSCGYVNLDHRAFSLRGMVPLIHILPFSCATTALEFTRYMQDCKEPLMGCIVPFAMLNDMAPFRDVFHMVMGWEGVYDSQIKSAALLDGCGKVDIGRFSGTLTSWDVDADTGGQVQSAAGS